MFQSALWLVCAVCLSLSLLAPGVVCVTTADNPGVRTVFTTKGIDYFHQVMIPYLESHLNLIQIPDISDGTDVVVGYVDYDITNIKIDSLSISESALTTSAGEGLTLQASGISIQVLADWSYEVDALIFPISDQGSADMSGSGISLSISVMVGADSQGHLDLSATGCSFYIDDVEIELNGGASWFYDLFDSAIADQVKDGLNSQVCDEVTQYINSVGSQALESLPSTIKVDEISQIDYTLHQSPTFTSSCVQADIKGEFQSASHPVEYPFKPSPLPPVSSVGTDKMLYAWLTDYVANSAAAVYEKAGLLSYTITDDMMPPGPFHLNTQTLSLFIPGLQKKYPNMNLKVVAHVVKPPTVSIKPHGANLTLPAQVDVYVLDNKTKSTPLAFSLGVQGDLIFVPYLTSDGGKQYIKGKALDLNAQLSLVKTNVGSFNVTTLQDVFKSLKGVFLTEVNQYGEKGLQLPVVDGLSLSNPNVTLGEGYMFIATDFNYMPTFKL